MKAISHLHKDDRLQHILVDLTQYDCHGDNCPGLSFRKIWDRYQYAREVRCDELPTNIVINLIVD